MRLLYLPESRHDAHLTKSLADAGHVVEIATGLDEGLALADLGDWGAVVCDWRALPPDRVSRVRETLPEAFVVAIAEACGEDDRIGALRAGADACFCRPFAFRELDAKLEAMARRMLSAASLGQGAGTAVTLLPSDRAVAVNGRRLELSPREYAVLEVLVQRSGEVVSADCICEIVWGDCGERASEVVRGYIVRLRKKLEADGNLALLHTVRGHGYCFRIETPAATVDAPLAEHLR